MWSTLLESPIVPSTDDNSLSTFFSLSDISKKNSCAACGPLCQGSSCCFILPSLLLLCKECFFQVFWSSHVEQKCFLPLQANGELSHLGLSTGIQVTEDSASLATFGHSAQALLEVQTSFVLLEGRRVSYFHSPLSFLLEMLRYLAGNESTIPTVRALWDCFYSYCFLCYGSLKNPQMG